MNQPARNSDTDTASPANGPVAEASAPPAPPVLTRGDDTLTTSESALLIAAFCTLIGVIAGITLA